MEVSPGPGLTLVVGRNGSGKSSFAEALEVLLTGTLMRWAPPAPVVVKEGWRSKHASGDTEISAEFFIEGSGKATVARTWADGADLASSTAWLQRAGNKRAPMSALGWDVDLKEYRPFLSHSELEAFFGKPSDLHDLLASVLGLEDLATADKHLNAARKSSRGCSHRRQEASRFAPRTPATTRPAGRTSGDLPSRTVWQHPGQMGHRGGGSGGHRRSASR
jgi:DNA repair exonuclease SbcCD ATPase subunit